MPRSSSRTARARPSPTSGSATGCWSRAPTVRSASRTFLNTHKDHVSTAPYVELDLASGRTLSLSPRHFIPVAASSDGAWADHVAKGADEIVAGDFVWSRSTSGVMGLDRVVAARTKAAVGAYNPLTMNGTIVVDGVVASAHSDRFLDEIVSADTQTKVYQVILAPVRLAYRVLGPQRMATVTESWGRGRRHPDRHHARSRQQP